MVPCFSRQAGTQIPCSADNINTAMATPSTTTTSLTVSQFSDSNVYVALVNTNNSQYVFQHTLVPNAAVPPSIPINGTLVGALVSGFPISYADLQSFANTGSPTAGFPGLLIDQSMLTPNANISNDNLIMTVSQSPGTTSQNVVVTVTFRVAWMSNTWGASGQLPPGAAIPSVVPPVASNGLSPLAIAGIAAAIAVVVAVAIAAIMVYVPKASQSSRPVAAVVLAPSK